MPNQKTAILLFALIVLTMATAVQSAACTCAGPRSFKPFQPCGVFWNADVVFIGTAEKVSIEQIGADGKPIISDGKMAKRTLESNRSDGRRDARMIARFSVEKPIRGVEGQTVEVETSPSTASCGYPFKEGERYFVYLRRGKDGRFVEFLCGATVLLKDAAADLEYLQAVENGEKGGRVYGNVHQTVRKSFKEQGEYLPIAKTKIFLESVRVKDAAQREQPKYKKREFQTTTDERGFYLFQNIPAGLYKVRAEFQNGLREIYTRADLTEHYVSIDEDKRRCGGYNFNATSQGSLEGRVVGSDGQNPPPQQYISLIPVDENGKPLPVYSSTGVWAGKDSGRFYFDLVPPGKYLLAINPKNCPSREKSEFGRMFLPGVADETAAAIVSVAENERTKTADFRLLPSLKERVFSGVVLAADKTPISGAKVFMIDGDTNECMNLGGLGETKTDEFGRFQIEGYESYKYRIRAYVEKPARLYSELIAIPTAGNFENLELIVSKTY